MMFGRKTRRAIARQTTYTVTATNKHAPYKQLARMREATNDERRAMEYARTLRKMGYAVVVTRATTERLLP